MVDACQTVIVAGSLPRQSLIMDSFRNPLIMSLSSLFGVYYPDYPMFGAKTKGLPRGIAVRWALVLLALTSGMGGVQAGREEHVCSSIDIRNRVDQFDILENCTVIEGKLHIQLIDYADSSDYAHLQFPKLVEITQYLLLYRVYGLKTLSHIFPNLSVIRGQELFYNYALVVFEMPNFEELGLPSLQVISRGPVRIEKNPNLCYIDTIDWMKITSSAVKMEDNFILQNKDIDECVNVCPKDETDPNTPNICPSIDIENQGTQFLCWNSESCQKVCPSECGTRGCFSEVNSWGAQIAACCDSLCMGGCTGRGPEQCLACRYVFFSGRCQTKCPPGTFKYLNRRCLLADECRVTTSYGPRTRGANSGQAPPGWKLYEGECVEECPSGYTEDKQDSSLCAKCDGMCPKVCPGIVVDNVAAAQKLKGCTRIDGILEIQIRGGSHVGNELEENLGSIQEIKYYVKIVRSYAIISLQFLKNLRIIHGERLNNDRYALFILDNQNLQDIWDFDTHPNLTIAKGKAFFHFNRKLCLNKINKLVDSVPGLRNQTDEKDIDPSTNGDQVACDISQLKLDLMAKESKYAIVRWENFHLSDSRQLLNWVVNYREAPEKNITFNARDACGMDDWQTEDVRPDIDKNASHVAAILLHLKPFTQYAVYVQSYTIATADRGAMSSIVYFTTDPDVPTTARDITATSKISGELQITWKEPSQPNGLVTHYYVYWQLQPLDPNKFDKRNYCIDKLRLPGAKKQDVIEEEKKNETLSGQCCACPKSKEEVRIEAQERMFQIEFENFLQNFIYIKRPTKIKRKGRSVDYMGPVNKRRKRSQGAVIGGTTTNANNPYSVLSNLTNYMNMSGHLNHSLPVEPEEHEPYEAAVVYNKTELTLTNLKHFQEYSIEVIACHDYIPGMDKKRCSNRAITTARTLPDDKTDTINEKNITVRNESETSTSVYITWTDPPSPNGLIVTYELELNKADTANFQPYTYCLTHKKYREIHGYVSEPLMPGNWSFKIRATSLAGNGSWTSLMYFWVADEDVAKTQNVTVIVVVSITVCLVVISVVVATVCAVVRKRLNSNVPLINYISVNPEYWSTEPVYTPDEWEVDRDKISLIRELGQGSFGMVYEGIAKPFTEFMEEETKVAVKTVNEKASIRDRMEFLNEASVMKAFNCYHVVRLLGVVSSQPTWVIMELMANGDLKNYLRMHRPDEVDNIGRKPPSLKEILQMAGEIADGMAYLASKKYVHCDLAARNCMVAETHIVKIGDFGMTRDIYETDYYRKGGKGLLPVRWMSPESLKDGVFTSQSDVWSFGVVLWEMATLAAQPYQGLANEQVLKYVIDGGIMEKPEGCPDRLYEELMLKCWEHSPKNRPTFQEIIEILVPNLPQSFKDISWFFSEERKQQDTLEHLPEVKDDEGLEMDDSNVHTPLEGSPLRTQQRQESGCVDDMDLDDIDCESQVSSESGLEGAPLSRQLRPPLRKWCTHQEPCECYVQSDSNKTHKHDSQLRHSGSGDSDCKANPLSLFNNRTNHIDSSPSSAIHSNEGSKGSSKSSDSNHSQLNGIVNGHLPQHYVTPPRC